jgi:energy-converting hydrogenase Eha subunit C
VTVVVFFLVVVLVVTVDAEQLELLFSSWSKALCTESIHSSAKNLSATKGTIFLLHPINVVQCKVAHLCLGSGCLGASRTLNEFHVCGTLCDAVCVVLLLLL